MRTIDLNSEFGKAGIATIKVGYSYNRTPSMTYVLQILMIVRICIDNKRSRSPYSECYINGIRSSIVNGLEGGRVFGMLVREKGLK